MKVWYLYFFLVEVSKRNFGLTIQYDSMNFFQETVAFIQLFFWGSKLINKYHCYYTIHQFKILFVKYNNMNHIWHSIFFRYMIYVKYWHQNVHPIAFFIFHNFLLNSYKYFDVLYFLVKHWLHLYQFIWDISLYTIPKPIYRVSWKLSSNTYHIYLFEKQKN